MSNWNILVHIIKRQQRDAAVLVLLHLKWSLDVLSVLSMVVFLVFNQRPKLLAQSV